MDRARITVELRDGEDRIRQSFDGTAEVTGRTVILSYAESGENGMEGQARITAKAREIVIERRGTVRMTQRLSVGLPAVFTYSTPHGEYDIRVDTQKLHTEIKERRGRLWAEFYQNMGGLPERKTLEIKYTVTKDGKEF